MVVISRLCLALTLAASFVLSSQPQEGPRWSWGFVPARAGAGFAEDGAPALAGRDAPTYAPDEVGGGFVIRGAGDVLVADAEARDAIRRAAPSVASAKQKRSSSYPRRNPRSASPLSSR